MGNQAEFERIGAADVDKNLDCLVFGISFISRFAFHLPGGGEGGNPFKIVFFQTLVYFLFCLFANSFEFGGDQNIIGLAQEIPSVKDFRRLFNCIVQ